MNPNNFFQRVIGPAITIVTCVALVLLFRGLSRGIDYHAVIYAVRGTPRRLIWLSILFTALSYLALIARDDCALVYIGARVAAGPLLLALTCASALGNAIGFGALTAESVRERVYGAAGLRPGQIDRVMLFIEVGFGLGLVTVMAASALLAGPALAKLLSLSTAELKVSAAMLLLLTTGVIAAGVRHQGPLLVADSRSGYRVRASFWCSCC